MKKSFFVLIGSIISSISLAYDGALTQYRNDLSRAYAQRDPANCRFVLLDNLTISAMARMDPQGALQMQNEKILDDSLNRSHFFIQTGNLPAAKQLLQPWANQGQACAMGNLAIVYIKEKNYAQAKYWAEQAASQNNNVGLTVLGSLYYNGIGVVKNQELAQSLWQRAAQLGNSDAIRLLSQ